MTKDKPEEKKKDLTSEDTGAVESEEEGSEKEKDVIEVAKEEVKKKAVEPTDDWKPRTILGKKVKSGAITSINDIFDHNLRIIEPEIVDTLVHDLGSDLLMVGQSKGKFGGGAKRIFKQTQKKTPEGNKPSFSSAAVVGNYNGIIGVGFGKSKDTVPSRDKATRNAKLNVFRIRRGCGSWLCSCSTPHSIPYTVEGKCGSVRIQLLPAPKGKGLVVEKECAKILKLAGLNDVWSKTFGQTKVKRNLIRACVKALEQLSEIKIQPDFIKQAGLIEGPIMKQ